MPMQLDWQKYMEIADKFQHKARFEDREDLRQDIILRLAEAGSNDGHKPDNNSWMYRIASFTVAQYWRDYYKLTNGIDCGHCSNAQRKKCKEQDLCPDYCPRAIEIESMSKPINNGDGDGDAIELWQTLADDKAIDLDAWLDAKTWLAGCPQRLVRIANKKVNGNALSQVEINYLNRYRQKELKKSQKTLI
jgi:DNA-directed RNA polymerase specialized sigma24 family protein